MLEQQEGIENEIKKNENVAEDHEICSRKFERVAVFFLPISKKILIIITQILTILIRQMKWLLIRYSQVKKGMMW